MHGYPPLGFAFTDTRFVDQNGDRIVDGTFSAFSIFPTSS
jgi:hypothetical protein